MATTGIIVPALMPVGELCTVIQGEEEFTTGKEEEKEGKRQANHNKGAEPKGSAGHKKEDGKTKGKQSGQARETREHKRTRRDSQAKETGTSEKKMKERKRQDKNAN